MPNKKDRELRYLREAQGSARDLLPQSTACLTERPDFLFKRPEGILGIEMIEWCREDERKVGPQLERVVEWARDAYFKMAGANPISVSAVFAPGAEKVENRQLSSSLARFVFDHRTEPASDTWQPEEVAVPDGFSYIGVFPPARGQGDGVWDCYSRAGKTFLETKKTLEDLIAEKDCKVTDYRAAAAEVWLLIVNDLFLGLGAVTIRAQDVNASTFGFAFDKVLVFERQKPDGSGQVMELKRASPG